MTYYNHHRHARLLVVKEYLVHILAEFYYFFYKFLLQNGRRINVYKFVELHITRAFYKVMLHQFL